VTRSHIELSVIIVSHNSSGSICDCLEALRSELRRTSHEVFVVDAASSDATVSLVQQRYPGVRLIACASNVGFSAGNNLALQRCRGRYVLLLNPDTVPGRGSLRALVTHLENNPSVGIVGPRLVLPNGEVQPECARNLPRLGNLLSWLLLLDKVEWALRFGRRHRSARVSPPPGTLLDRFCLLSWERAATCSVESVCGAAMMIRREVVEEVGLLDATSALYLDDIDYCRRSLDAGFRIDYVAGARITHLWKQSSSPRRREGDFYALGCHAIWLYLRKHEGRIHAALYALMAAGAALLRLLIAIPASLVLGGFWIRQRAMAIGLARWALRLPRRPPRFGFANEGGPEAAEVGAGALGA
jgi:GT2 family glycosyltransferase